MGRLLDEPLGWPGTIMVTFGKEQSLLVDGGVDGNLRWNGMVQITIPFLRVGRSPGRAFGVAG